MKTLLKYFGIGILFPCQLLAQSPILALTSTYVASTSDVSSYSTTPAQNSGSFNNCSSTVFDFTYNSGTSNALKLLNITANGRNYFINRNSTAIIKLRRVDNAKVTGNRSIVFFETNGGMAMACPSSPSISFKSPYQGEMESFLKANFINQGTDNLFTNTSNGDGNNNNIERVDVIFPDGLSTPSLAEAGFALFDRGLNYFHDPFRIAAITRLDAYGNPSAFSGIKTCIGGDGTNNGSWGHPTMVNGNRDLSVYVMRKEVGNSYLQPSAAKNQQLGGVFFSFEDLGVAPNQVIYGYALLGMDGEANPTPSQLLTLNDPAVYPTNSTETTGGLDMIAVNAFFTTGGPVLAAKNASLQGTVSKSLATVHWSIGHLLPGQSVELEASKNGSDFFTVYVIPTTRLQGNYKEQYIGGSRYYRLKIAAVGSPSYYSRTIHLVSNPVSNFKVYPTVVGAHQLLQVEGLSDGRYKAVFYSTGGTPFSFDLRIQNGKGSINPDSKDVGRGVYFLNLVGEKQEVYPGTKVILR